MVKISTGLRLGMLGSYGLSTYLTRGVIDVYTGAQPALADMAVSGTWLGRITTDGLAWAEGSSTNGLQMEQGVDGDLHNFGNWVLTPVVTGEIGWWRYRWWQPDPGELSTWYPRMDGAYGDSMVLSSPHVTAGFPVSIDSFYLTLIGE